MTYWDDLIRETNDDYGWDDFREMLDWRSDRDIKKRRDAIDKRMRRAAEGEEHLDIDTKRNLIMQLKLFQDRLDTKRVPPD